jgi:preprotein translocase subunit SecE
MKMQRHQVARPRTAPTLSRAEAARPPKPAVERERAIESERSGAISRLDQIKKQWLDTLAELKKVTWPDKETTKNLTLVVIALSAVLGLLLGGIDWVMQELFSLI